MHMLIFFSPILELSGSEIMTQIKGQKYFKNERKSTHNDPNSDFVIINAYANYYQITLICSKIFEWKQN